MARAENLQELIRRSSSTRRFFLSQPVEMQMALHRYGDEIHTAQELRRYMGLVENNIFFQ